MAERWATFDCYGTLIDWNGGIARELERLFGVERVARLLTCYHAIEPEVQREHPTSSYRDVLAMSLARLAERESLELAPAEHGALGQSLPSWPPFPEASAALEDARTRGWKLAILSNTDRDFLEASMDKLHVPFDMSIVASEIGSYKPAPGHWDTFERETGATRDCWVHVAASLFHDVVPATERGLRTVWINRLGEDAEPEPEIELHSLTGLGESLDSLVPA
ncbi:MAG TPA: HAD-IA family hydrolase [Gaiellaceae bacterium]|nr:HAD-IA family hydrolase [Gaiellaceae bacterium]